MLPWEQFCAIFFESENHAWFYSKEDIMLIAKVAPFFGFKWDRVPVI